MDLWIPPQVLRDGKVTYQLVEQHPGQCMVTASNAYHEGWMMSTLRTLIQILPVTVKALLRPGFFKALVFMLLGTLKGEKTITNPET